MLTPGLQPAKGRKHQKINLLRSLVLVLLGQRCYCRVDGQSMAPTYQAGDIIIYRPIERENNLILTEGDVVVLKHPIKNNLLIIKRINKIISPWLELRGDNAEISSDSRQFGMVNSNQLCGIVEYSLKGKSSKDRKDFFHKIWAEVL